MLGTEMLDGHLGIITMFVYDLTDSVGLTFKHRAQELTSPEQVC